MFLAVVTTTLPCLHDMQNTCFLVKLSTVQFQSKSQMSRIFFSCICICHLIQIDSLVKIMEEFVLQSPPAEKPYICMSLYDQQIVVMVPYPTLQWCRNCHLFIFMTYRVILSQKSTVFNIILGKCAYDHIYFIMLKHSTSKLWKLLLFSQQHFKFSINTEFIATFSPDISIVKHINKHMWVLNPNVAKIYDAKIVIAREELMSRDNWVWI